MDKVKSPLKSMSDEDLMKLLAVCGYGTYWVQLKTEIIRRQEAKMLKERLSKF